MLVDTASNPADRLLRNASKDCIPKFLEECGSYPS